MAASEKITILAPCKNPKRELLEDALQSLIRQTSGDWTALVITEPEPPPEIREWVDELGEPRIKLIAQPTPGFAAALNHGLRQVRTEFTAILLCDDRWSLDAVETLLRYRKDHPNADFFHSAHRWIDERGQPVGAVRPPGAAVTFDHFKRFGSPVKHLLCWRRSLALEIGGMNESLSVHGCDDFDFPWRMLEAGAGFQAIEECLYEYRIHQTHTRLTTHVPLEKQMAVLRAMFHSHGVSLLETDAFLQRASRYLAPSNTNQILADQGRRTYIRYFREARIENCAGYLEAGFKQRWFFPHRSYVIPKGGPDGLKLASRMAECDDPGKLRQVILYAEEPVLGRFPPSLFFDDDLQWHRQQFGRPGQVAYANLVIHSDRIDCYALQSDLVQRVSRAPGHRNQVNIRFKGWARLLLNSVLRYALDSGFGTVRVAHSELVMRNAGRRFNPKPELFERVYDGTPRQFGACREGDWWTIDVDPNRLGPLARRYEIDERPKTICIMHDTERSLGHRSSDPALAQRADAAASETLRRMLEAEAAADVSATYNVVGCFYDEIHGAISGGGHAIAFHSFDHRLPDAASPDLDGSEQLQLCRDVDYRLKGYRPPQSKILPGLNDSNLSQFNFEWLASSVRSLGAESPLMKNGIVKIPVHLDDYPLYRGELDYGQWEASLLALIEERDFVVVGLHDCYGHHWLDSYPALLKKLGGAASFSTLDQVAAELTLGQARWFEPPI